MKGKLRLNSSTKSPRPLSGVIEKLMRSLGQSTNFHGWQVVSHWPEIVGEQIASRATVVRFSEGVLYVAVNDAVWRQEIAMQMDEMLGRIHAYPFGRVVKRVQLVKAERRTNQDGNRSD